MKVNDFVVISNMRENSRESLTRLSKKTRIPVTTLHNKLKEYEGDLIDKFTSIVNFSKLGYKTKAQILLKPNPETKKQLEEFLMKHKAVNSLYKVSTSFEYSVEVIFKDMEELQDFLNKVDEFRVYQKEVVFVLNDMRREDFLSSPSYVALTAV